MRQTKSNGEAAYMKIADGKVNAARHLHNCELGLEGVDELRQGKKGLVSKCLVAAQTRTKQHALVQKIFNVAQEARAEITEQHLAKNKKKLATELHVAVGRSLQEPEHLLGNLQSHIQTTRTTPPEAQTSEASSAIA